MQTTTEPEKFRDSAGVWRQKNTVDEKEVWSNNQNDQEQQKFHLCGFIAPRDWELLVDTKNSDAVKNCQSAPIIVTWRKKLPVDRYQEVQGDTKNCRSAQKSAGRSALKHETIKIQGGAPPYRELPFAAKSLRRPAARLTKCEIFGSILVWFGPTIVPLSPTQPANTYNGRF